MLALCTTCAAHVSTQLPQNVPQVTQGAIRGVANKVFAHLHGMDLAFHRRLRAGFLEIARAEPGRCVVVDAARDKDEVGGAVWDAVAARIAG